MADELRAALAKLPTESRAACKEHIEAMRQWGDSVLDAYEPPPEEPLALSQIRHRFSYERRCAEMEQRAV